MIKLRAGKRDVLVPQVFREMTYRELHAIKAKADEGKPLDEFTVMQVITGFDIDSLQKSAKVWYERIDFDSLLSGVMRVLNNESPKKSAITVMGKKVKPKSFASCKLSQRIMLKSVFRQMRQEESGIFDLLPKALAICIAPQISKEWASEIDLIEADLWDCNAEEVFNNGAFFLQSSMIMRSNGRLSLFRLMTYGLVLAKDFLMSRIRFGSPVINLQTGNSQSGRKR